MMVMVCIRIEPSPYVQGSFTGPSPDFHRTFYTLARGFIRISDENDGIMICCKIPLDKN